MASLGLQRANAFDPGGTLLGCHQLPGQNERSIDTAPRIPKKRTRNGIAGRTRENGQSDLVKARVPRAASPCC